MELLLKGSDIFKNAKQIDCIRQSFIDLNINSNEESVQNLLNSAINNLERDISYDEANELIALILKCFSCLSETPLPIFNHLYEKSKTNSYTIITFVSVLSYLTNKKPNLDLSTYQPFIIESLKEIQPQLQNHDKLILFNQQIPFQFRIDIILDLLLSTQLNEQLIKGFSPFLISTRENDKFPLLESKIKNSELLPLFQSLSGQQDTNEASTEKSITTPYEKPIDNELILSFLSDPNPEANEVLQNTLFTKLTSERSNLLRYFQIIFENFPGRAIEPIGLLSYFNDEYVSHKDEFIEILNNVLIFHPKQKVFVVQPVYKPLNLEEPEFNRKLVSQLFEIVNQDPSNFKAYFCLECIAKSFPFIFQSIPQEVIDSVLPAFDNYALNFERKNDNDEEKMKKVKAAIESISFLLFTLNSPIVMDEFVSYFFSNHQNLSLSQILCFFITFVVISNTKLFSYLSVSFNKNKFIDVCKEIIEKRGIPENLFGMNFNYYMYNIIHNYCNEFFEVIESEAILEYFSKKRIFTELSEGHLTHLYFLSPINDYFLYENKNENFYAKTDGFFDIRGQNIPSWRVESRKVNEEISKEQIDSFINHYKQKYPNEPEVYEKIFPDVASVLKKKPEKIGDLLTKNKWIHEFVLLKKEFPLLVDHFNIMKDTVSNLHGFDRNDLQNFHDQRLASFYNEMKEFLINILQNFLTKFCRPTNHFAKIFNALIIITDYERIFSIIKENLGLIDKSCPYFAHLTAQKIEDIIVFFIQFGKDQKNKENFPDNSFNASLNTIINFILRPQYRQNELIMKHIKELIYLLKIPPINLKQIIYFLIISNNYQLQMVAVQLLSKINQVLVVNDRLINDFYNDQINAKEPNISLLSKIIKFSNHIIVMYRKQLTENILKNMLEKLKKKQEGNKIDNYNYEEEDDEVKLEDFVIQLLDVLPPNRSTFESFCLTDSSSTEIKDDKSEEENLKFHFYRIPEFIYQKAPSFWKLFNDYRPQINQILLDKYEKNPNIQPTDLYQKLPQFSSRLVDNYPECFSFEFRRTIFRQLMDKEIESCEKKLTIDSDNLLEDSFQKLGSTPSIKELKGSFLIRYKKNGVMEEGIDAGGLTRDWFTKFTEKVFDPSVGLFDRLEPNGIYMPNSSKTATTPENLKKFQVVGIVIAKALLHGYFIPAYFARPFIKLILQHENSIKPKDLQGVDDILYSSLNEYARDKEIENQDIRFEYTTIDGETIEFEEGGSEIVVDKDNVQKYIYFVCHYVLVDSIKEQTKNFLEGFKKIIKHNQIRMFTATELNLLICGIPKVDIEDLRNNVVYIEPLNADSKSVRLFFDAISKWKDENLAKLLYFITGTSRMPINGFVYFRQKNNPIKIQTGGDFNHLPQAHTCMNILSLPEYENEEQLNIKFLQALDYNDFGLK